MNRTAALLVTLAASVIAIFAITTKKNDDPGAGSPAPTAAPLARVSPPAEVREGTVAPRPAAAAGKDLHPSELLQRDGVSLRRAPMGREPGESVLEASFAAHPELRPEDPEADAIRRGRRLVDPIEGELAHPFDTPEALAEAYLDAIFQESPDMFHELRVEKNEFERLFWPEFPQSRPIANTTASDAWHFHNVHCLDGVTESLQRFGGQRLYFQSLRFETGIARYRNFNLYHGAVIEAATADGDLVTIELAPVFAERNGRWKIYMYDA